MLFSNFTLSSFLNDVFVIMQIIYDLLEKFLKNKLISASVYNGLLTP